MEMIWNYVLWFTLISLMSIIWLLKRSKFYSSKLPPGRKGWPVIGNFFDLGSLPYRNLAALKQEYGPIMLLHLGSVKTMVVQSAGAAEELFKNHDLSFIDRYTVETMKSHDFHKSTFSFALYGNYWRTLKRIRITELFTNKKVSETVLIRQKCVDDMLSWIEKEVEKDASSGVEIMQFVFPALYNMIGNLTLSLDLVSSHSVMASEFYTAMSGFVVCLGRPNVSDLFPWFKWFDLQGLRRKMDHHMEKKALEIVSGFVDERVKQRRQKQGRSEQRRDFLDVLLDFKDSGNNEPAKLSEREFTIFLMEMFLAGTETTSLSTEWAMSELLKNPETMINIKAELSRVVGANKKFEESDIDNLPYLRATVEETLRLHPPVPFLIPTKVIQDTTFMGYSIPKTTQVWVNAWAIGRDEESWEDALCFKPERFIDSNIRYNGQNYKFIPFGGGRRICPGIPLAHRMLPLVLGSLLHQSDWKLCEGETTVDMTESMGLTVGKLHQLKAIPKRTT